MSTTSIESEGGRRFLDPHPDDEDRTSRGQQSNCIQEDFSFPCSDLSSVPISVDTSSGVSFEVEDASAQEESCAAILVLEQEESSTLVDPRQEQHVKNLEESSSEPLPTVGVTQAVYSQAQGLWGWGKDHVFILGSVMGMVENLADHVIHHVAGTNLKEIDHGLVRPHLQAMDAAVLSPAFHVVTRVVQETSHHVVHELMRPILEQFIDRRSHLEIHNLEISVPHYNESCTGDTKNLANNKEDGGHKTSPPVALLAQPQTMNDNYVQNVSSSILGSTYDTSNHEYQNGENLSQNYEEERDDASFFIGYEDNHDDLSDCWMPLVSSPPPNSPAEYYYDDSSLNLSASEAVERQLPFAYVSY